MIMKKKRDETSRSYHILDTNWEETTRNKQNKKTYENKWEWKYLQVEGKNISVFF